MFIGDGLASWSETEQFVYRNSADGGTNLLYKAFSKEALEQEDQGLKVGYSSFVVVLVCHSF